MTIYHFANEKLGITFITAFEKIKAQFPELKIILIFSSLSYNRIIQIFPSFLKRKLCSNHNNIRNVYSKIIITTNINDERFVSVIKSEDLGIVTGFNQIFSKQLIARFKKVVNFHPSILPFYRGPVPSYWVLKNNEKFSGFTYHVLTEKIDAGEVLIQAKVKIKEGTSEEDLDNQIAELGATYAFDIISSLIKRKKITKITECASLVYKVKVNYKSFPKMI